MINEGRRNSDFQGVSNVPSFLGFFIFVLKSWVLMRGTFLYKKLVYGFSKFFSQIGVSEIEESGKYET